MTAEKHIEPVRRSVDVGCSVAEAFRIFTAEIDSWWPLATHSIGQTDAVACYFETRNAYESGWVGVLDVYVARCH